MAEDDRDDTSLTSATAISATAISAIATSAIATAGVGASVVAEATGTSDECSHMRAAHNVRPGTSWGTLPASLQQRWYVGVGVGVGVGNPRPLTLTPTPTPTPTPTLTLQVGDRL